MASYDEELIKAAIKLLDRKPGQPGRLASARVRRSISTSYYAIFHFLSDEVTRRIVGAGSDLRARRRALARGVTHRGLRTSFDKIRGATIHSSVKGFFALGGLSVESAPDFARFMAKAFLDAQTKRESADYDLNEPLSEIDAHLLALRVRREIRRWRKEDTKSSRDFKQAMAVLVLLRGQLRQEN